MYKIVNTYKNGIVLKTIDNYFINNNIIFAHGVNISCIDRVSLFHQIIMTRSHCSHNSHIYYNNMLYIARPVTTIGYTWLLYVYNMRIPNNIIM